MYSGDDSRYESSSSSSCSSSDSCSERVPVAVYSQLPSGVIPIQPPQMRCDPAPRVVSSYDYAVRPTIQAVVQPAVRRTTSTQSAVGFGFRAPITPLGSLTTPHSGHNSMVEFIVRRKNSTIFLQWEPFTGSLGQRGISYVGVHQTLAAPPPYPMAFRISMSRNGSPTESFLRIDPGHCTPIMFSFSTVDGKTEPDIGDTIVVEASCVHWMTMI